MRRTPLRAAAVTIGGLALAVGPLTAPAFAVTDTIQIVGINDFHGRIEALDDNDTDDPTDDTGGAAMLAGALNELRAAEPDTIFVSAGDNVGASTFVSAVQDDEPTIDALNEMGLQVGAAGNHEFDRGYDWLADPATHGVDGTGLAEWPTLGANVEGESPDMPESTTITTASGVVVGFVGVVTEQTRSLVSPDGIAGITFDDPDPVTAANREAAELKAAGADVVVLLTHEGSSSTDCATVASQGAFGEIVQGASADINAIFSGHTHRAYSCSPVAGTGGFTGPVVQTGEYGSNFAQVRLNVVTETDTTTVVGSQIVPNAGFTPDPEVAAIVEAAVADAEVVGREPIGEIEGDITRAFTTDAEGMLDDDRGSESPLGNFVADVQLAATASPELGGAQIALMNPGGLRADFCMEPDATECPEPTQGDGIVTYADAATVQPFANGLVTMTLTGAQVRQVLEEQWQPEGSSRPFLALGLSAGFGYTYDPDAAAGAHVVDVTLNGEALVPEAPYRVTVNSFLATGGDNFLTLAAGTERQDNGFNDLNVLVGYFQANSPITAEQIAGLTPRRAVAADAPPGGGGGVPVVDDKDCADFATQAQAQAALAGGDPYNLDSDEDGTACEAGVGGPRGTSGTSGRNRGLRVDTGVTGSGGSQLWALGGLSTVLLAAGAVAARRRGSVR